MDTVLIVDDSSFIVEGLVAFLKKRYRILAAYGGAECLEILRRETPSVIILDIMMEPMDGWETLSRIKENPATRAIPVLMFSAKKISPEEAEEHRIRIDDFIAKPISPQKIIDAIEKVLTRRDNHAKSVAGWRSAGISQEKIDEYLALVTSLEVDLSLCQNMKIQCGLVHPADTDQEEFQAVIHAIEVRIRQEREMIGKLAREMNDAVQAGTPPGAGAPQESPAGAGDAGSGPPAADAGERPGSPPPEGGQGTELRNDPIAPDAGPATRTTPDPAVTAGTPPAQAPPDTGQAGTLPESGEGPSQGSVLPESPADPELSHGDPAAPGPVPGTEPGLPGKETASSSPHADTETPADEEPEPASPPVSSGPVPAAPARPGVFPERNVIPADPDSNPEWTGSPSLTGAGTDLPMPWDQRERKPSGAAAGQGTGKISSPARPPGGGFLARVITLVRSIFGKRG